MRTLLRLFDQRDGSPNGGTGPLKPRNWPVPNRAVSKTFHKTYTYQTNSNYPGSGWARKDRSRADLPSAVVPAPQFSDATRPG